jgi:hypothetical protein
MTHVQIVTFIDSLPAHLRAALHPQGRWALVVPVSRSAPYVTLASTSGVVTTVVVARSPARAAVEEVFGQATDEWRALLHEANVVDMWQVAA